MNLEDHTKAINQGMEIEGTEQRYVLTCEVKKKFLQKVNNGIPYEMKVIYLVPQMSGEMIRFYNCYLPEYVVEVDNNELVFLNYKNGRAFRGFLSPPTRDINERHIFIMSNDTIDFLDSIYSNDMKIQIECVPFSEQKDFDA